MSPATIFTLRLALGYLPWLLCFGTNMWQRLNSPGPKLSPAAGISQHFLPRSARQRRGMAADL